MNEDLVDSFVSHCDDVPDFIPAEDFYCDSEDLSFDDWLLSLANSYGGY